MATSSRSIAQDAALFFVLMILLDGCFALVALPSMSSRTLTTTFYLALYVHIGFTLYPGAFTKWRTVTWLALIAACAVAEMASFAAYILPWGQLAFWLASHLPESLSNWLSDTGISKIMGSDLGASCCCFCLD
jgi:Cytochrome b(N-terminal)/b6/petB